MWKIAIIDDDQQVLQGMRKAIPWDRLNAEWVGEAMNGEDGLRMIRRERPDIVITDIYMPVMNGLDMIERLRDEQFDGKIVILSGYSDFEYARKALRLNVCDYLSKPVSLPTLHSVLGQIVADLSEDEEKRMEQEDLHRKLSLYAPFVEQEWIKSAVSGTLTESYLRSGAIPAPYRHWARGSHLVLAVDIARDARFSGLSLPDLHLFRFAVRNIATELAGAAFETFEHTELYGTRSALVLHAERETDPSAIEARVAELGMKLIDAVRSYLKLTLFLGVGGIKSDWREISDSTEEAFHAIDRKSRPLAAGYALYSNGGKDADAASGTAPIRPVKFYQELAAALKLSHEQQANELIDAFVGQLKEANEATPAYLQMLARELWTIFAYSLYEVGMVLDEMFPDERLRQERSAIAQPEQLAEWLKGKVSFICNSRQWKGNSKHRQAVDFMIQYIHENYREEITLADLADKVYISRNYLSNIFKNTTGESFNTYLTRVRMEKAKELLMERRMLVYEVAESVGYKNVPYFSTLFKKFTGMNPTELAK
ncbi:response regulator transcription factor [Cohnella thermotolerans]|uniref:response regulator transcription factor n=1 Tax=Cohnella thermotolerans TaxID=329858 RepID=UPI000408A89A|nr:response regulator transcription factor [Cohnella thermotolerans]